MNLDDAEPAAGPWRILSLVELTAQLLDVSARVVDRPRIIAVDGRSASGKTSLARRLNGVVPRSAVVHTDDIAWWHSAFDWSAPMVDGVLGPVRRGESVDFRPPAWEARGRPGSVAVPAGTSVCSSSKASAPAGARPHTWSTP